jgi:hypothetical protein
MPKTNRTNPQSQDARSTTKRITYLRLQNGDWGLRAEGFEELLTGDNVTVMLRKGETKLETVGAVVWRGRFDRKPVGIYKIAKRRSRKS